MRKLKALLYKDYLLLIRDLAGLAMMFLMPLSLVALMAYLQDSTFNSINESRVPLLLLNADKDSLGNAVERNILSTPVFNVVTKTGGEPLTEEALEKSVAKGDYQIGIVIPENTTKYIRENVQKSVMQTFSGISDSTVTDSPAIRIYIDPTTKNSFKETLMSTMREHAASLQNEFVLGEVTKEVNKLIPFPVGNIRINSNPVQIKEQYAKLDEARIIPNSVQHNVPAWGMFAVFFIVISLSGNIIKEREDGSFTRLLTMPCPYWLYLLSKIIVYLAVCLLQLTLMFIMGKYVLPMLGLPALTMGHSVLALVLMSVSASLAAIGYGIAIGKIATSNQQAAIFGSISVVILAAIGGVWIPTFVMPYVMQIISKLSPLNWGLSGFYGIFVRDGNWYSVLPESIALLLFFVICSAVAVIYDKRKRFDN
ncbi:MAG: ABC transporter permease [Prevotellaceae bacterium]|jgi:ABC-2 type transport system permease protein|nr:ABC transporter permease [Prevotellaceae bacterium]